jgi:hypothetical protein
MAWFRISSKVMGALPDGSVVCVEEQALLLPHHQAQVFHSLSAQERAGVRAIFERLGSFTISGGPSPYPSPRGKGAR